MKTLLKTILCAALLLAASGCAYRIAGVQPGASGDEVTRQAGKPSDTWREGGAEVWEYAFGPIGMQTYLARFDGGKLASVSQVLTEDSFKRINAGASRESVHQMLGRPGYKETYSRINEEVWSWRFLADTTPRAFNVHFDARTAQVKHTSFSVDPREITYFGGSGANTQ